MQKFDLALLDEEQTQDNAPKSGQLSPAVMLILQEVQREMVTDENDEPLSGQELNGLVTKVSKRLGFELTSFERDQILGSIETDRKPFGILQPLVDDKRISDIIVSDYSKITVQQGRRNLNTDITFPNQEAYEAFVERLLKKGGATVSTKKPIADGMIGSFARLHVVHKSLCEGGPYLTIRLNRFADVVCLSHFANLTVKFVLDFHFCDTAKFHIPGIH